MLFAIQHPPLSKVPPRFQLISSGLDAAFFVASFEEVRPTASHEFFRSLWNGGFYCDCVTGILQGILVTFSFVHVRKDTTQWETCVKMEKRCGEQI